MYDKQGGVEEPEDNIINFVELPKNKNFMIPRKFLLTGLNVTGNFKTLLLLHFVSTLSQIL